MNTVLRQLHSHSSVALYFTLIVIGNEIWIGRSNVDSDVPHPHIDTSTVTLLWLHFRFCIVFGPSYSTVEGWYFQFTFMTICCLLIVLCIRGLPSRICHAAHTAKQWLRERLNRLTAQRSFRIQQKSRFSQIQQFQNSKLCDRLPASPLQSTYNSLSPKFESGFHFWVIGPWNFQTGLEIGSSLTGIDWIMTWMKEISVIHHYR